MMKPTEYENRTRNAVARLPRRTGRVSAIRRRRAADSFSATFNACASRTRLQEEIRREPEPTWTETQGQALGLGPRFPRHGLVDGFRFSHLAGEFCIGQPFPADLSHHYVEPFSIVHLPIVESASLFIDVAEQMEWFDADISTVQAALKQRPEVFHSVSVYVAIRVFDGVVNHGVLIVRFQPVVGKQFIGEDRRASLNVLANVLLKFLLAPIVYNHRANVSATLQHSHHKSLVFPASASDNALTLRFVHIPSFAADEGFVDLDFMAQFAALLPLLGKPDAVQHEPRGFLGDSEGAVDLATAYSVLSVLEHPHSRKPFIETNRGVLHDGSDLRGKLPLGMATAALPAQLILEEANILAATGRADYAILPFRTTGNKIVQAILSVRETLDCFLKGLGFVGGFHTSSLPQDRGLVNYIIAPGRGAPDHSGITTGLPLSMI